SEQGMTDRANFLDTCLQSASTTNLTNLLPPAGQRSAAQCVDVVATNVFGLTLVPEERQLCIDYMNSGGTFDATNGTQVNDKVKGLLVILGQHPYYEVR